MKIRLHANATTTPKTRRYIQQSGRRVATLARELGVTEVTVRRWKARGCVSDASHTPQHLQTTLRGP